MSVNKKNAHGQTVLLVTMERFTARSYSMVNMLTNTAGVDFNTRDMNSMSALHYAVIIRQASFIELLATARNLDPNIKDMSGATPLQYAVERRLVDCVRALLDLQGIELNATDNHGRSVFSCNVCAW